MTDKQESLFPEVFAEKSDAVIKGSQGRPDTLRLPTDASVPHPRVRPAAVRPTPPSIAEPGADVPVRSYSQQEGAESYLSVRQVADRFAVSVQTVWRWKNEGFGFPTPVAVTPGTTRWRMTELVAFERGIGGAVR